ncbi:MAG: hypothetical protein WC977_09885 [Anaerovoracaceae bacterium]|jgi:hypothetical protein
MDEPTSMIIPDEIKPPPLRCGACGSESLEFYLMLKESAPLIIAMCLSCGNQAGYVGSYLTEQAENGTDG